MVAIAVAAAAVFGSARTASAERHRVVILEFRGPNADKFHADVVKLVRKTHTVVGIAKWEETADDLGATKINSKNVKKVAQKLNVDGVIIGEVEKRRDRYILRIKVREGRSGDYTGNPIEATSGESRLDARGTRDLRDELLDTIDTLDPAVSSDDDRGRDRDRDDDRATSRDEDEDDRGRDRDRDRDEDMDEDDRASSKGKGKDKGKGKGKGKGRDEDMDEDEDLDDRDSRAKSGFKGKDDRRGRDQVEDEEPMAKGKGKGKGKPLDDGDDPRSSDGDDDENPIGGSGNSKGFVRGKGKGTDGKDRGEMSEDSDERDSDVRDVGSEDGDDADRDRDRDSDEDGDRVASRDDEDGGGDEDNEVRDRGEPEDEPEDDGVDRLSPANRAVDAVVGISVMRRTMNFQVEQGLINKPLGYKGAPVAGAYVDADIYPLALNKRAKGITKNLGVTLLADKVIRVNTNAMGMKLPSKQWRYGLGVVFRQPLGSALLTARVRYSKMGFSISRDTINVDVPDVGYTVIDPGIGIVYPIGKLAIGADFAFMLIPNTGPIQARDQYGAATVTGFDGEVHADYLISKRIFARLAFHFVTIGYKFKGNGDMTTDRDGDAEQDVFGARDSYLGGFVAAGYLF